MKRSPKIAKKASNCSLTIIYFRGQYTDEITTEPDQLLQW